MARLLLTLRYDGTRYHGWQVQANAVTVQQTLQDAVERVTGARSGVTGCSRTDAGVHAAMFCCAMDTDFPLRGDKMAAALNACLPRDIAVYGCREVPAAFHPRYDALGKRYGYYFWNESFRHPFWEGRAWHFRRPIEPERLNAAAAAFVGTHDFASFCASGSHVEDTVRTVTACRVERPAHEPGLVRVVVQADGFLYNMVRILAGTLADMAAGRLPCDGMPAILRAENRAAAGQTAPACGLVLEQVFYPPWEKTDEGGRNA